MTAPPTASELRDSINAILRPYTVCPWDITDQILALLAPAPSVPPDSSPFGHCDKCDPSFNCWNTPSKCVKVPPAETGTPKSKTPIEYLIWVCDSDESPVKFAQVLAAQEEYIRLRGDFATAMHNLNLVRTQLAEATKDTEWHAKIVDMLGDVAKLRANILRHGPAGYDIYSAEQIEEIKAQARLTPDAAWASDKAKLERYANTLGYVVEYGKRSGLSRVIQVCQMTLDGIDMMDVYRDEQRHAGGKAGTFTLLPSHASAEAFWSYWKANGETHKHGFYESTWGAINAALAVQHQP